MYMYMQWTVVKLILETGFSMQIQHYLSMSTSHAMQI